MRGCGSTPVRSDNHDRIELKLKGLRASASDRLASAGQCKERSPYRNAQASTLDPGSSGDGREFLSRRCDCSNHAAHQPTDRWTDNALREVAARAFPRRWTSSKGNALLDQRHRSLSERPALAVDLSEVERVMGIEPTLEAWEAAVLPLNYTRVGVSYRPQRPAEA